MTETIMKIFAQFEKKSATWFLVAISFAFFLFRLPSFFEPYWYGDEGIYEVIGFALRHGRLLYQGIWDNKPPMLYLMYALFDGNQSPTRVLSFLFGLVSIWLFFILAKRLFTKEKGAMIATSIYAVLLGIPLLEGNIANAENFMVLPTIAAALLIFLPVTHDRYAQKQTRRELLFFLSAGFLLGISFLFKVVGLFDMAAFTLFAFFIAFKHHTNFFKAVIRVLPICIGFATPLILTALFFFMHHAFPIFLQSTLFSNVGYVNYGNQFVIPQGLLIFKALLLGVVALALFLKREKISAPQLFVFLWLGFSIFSALFSQRPYTHYVLVMVASFALLAGFTFAKKSVKIVSGILVVLIVIFIATNFWIYSKSVQYYTNFTTYLTGMKTGDAYQSFFDRIVPRDYEIAEYIKLHAKPNQTLFVWGDSGQLYKLTNMLPPGRYIVAYHITSNQKTMTETKLALEQNPPTFIVLLPNQDALPMSLRNYEERIILGGAIIYERIF